MCAGRGFGYVDGQELELWRDSRLVARFSKKR
jgi:hypothetical protein